MDPFIVPTLEEVEKFIEEAGLTIKAKTFFAFYQANDWKANNQPIKDWRALLIRWEQRKESGQYQLMESAVKKSEKADSGFGQRTLSKEEERALFDDLRKIEI